MKRVILTLACLASSGCVYSFSETVDVHEDPDEDPQYGDVLEDATRSSTVYADFETRYEVAATYLSPKFRTAFIRRLEKVYMESQYRFEEATAKAGFFVSIFAPDGDRTDLANPLHWTLVLKTPEGAIKPVAIKRLNDKERWRAFFDFVDTWSTEYLVVFDAPSVDPNSPDLVEKTSMNLVFANADAKVSLSW